jgi:molybdopterin synthase catalytic subunit
MPSHIQFYLTDRPIDVAALSAGLHDPGAGAVVTFDGRVRDHNDGLPVTGLEHQAYPALALSTGRRILEEESTRHHILRAIAVHRTGTIALGESAVWVGVSSGHRAEAFAAAQAIMDRLKYELPIWKKEFLDDGRARWVGPDNSSPEIQNQPPKSRTSLQQVDHPVLESEIATSVKSKHTP